MIAMTETSSTNRKGLNNLGYFGSIDMEVPCNDLIRSKATLGTRHACNRPVD